MMIESMPDFQESGESGRLVVELGPLEHVPYSTFMFLEVIDNWKGGTKIEFYDVRYKTGKHN